MTGDKAETGGHRALVVDDEPDILELLEITLGRMSIETDTAADLATARERLAARHYDLCLTDMRLPDGSGIELVEHIQQQHPELPVAVITAYGSMESAVQALKTGAFDFVSKPVDLQVLRKLVGTALKLSDTKDFPGRDRRSRNELIGDSPLMQRTRSLIAKLARSQAPVYISGESGTGKELVARLIHRKGPRAEQPFIAVNCGAIPAELMESEFFGHRKGSFTGATSDKAGLFQAADGGTLFLDEVAELPLHMQVKLLRAIQEKAVRPVGAQHEVPIDVRILSATHKNLARLVEEGAFRQDLYYRLNVIELKLPALRERPEDIPQLADHLLRKLSRGHSDAPVLGTDALDALRSYGFPGNVRELENILERALTMCEGPTIQALDLALPGQGSGSGNGSSPPAGEVPLEDYLEQVERQAILDALEKTRNNKTAAARLLGITFRALRYRLKKLGLD
ncbi:sigma-54 dependent transcriptional regulator [Thiohalobacter sp. IOR34]|uniref:sigma-54-dependent transcriptional regulator n=1 Tax=Thiohalobacter sp. IOR34 TaxID=3057176 RepID=UPI0025B043AC|nr:sigma-54 dependent transcriptional regulator [Thiohalobacter sp. IOR34]WJW74931.1 sigma-54 dependent transcriptional regulator [Thiohalobacter sp. IOR34]